MVCLHNGVLLSCENKGMKFSGKWMEPDKKSILSEAAQTQKGKHDVYLFRYFIS